MARSERRQNLARLGEIATVAARHGFGYLLDRGGPGGRGGSSAQNGDGSETEASHGTRGARVRSMLDELGPTFVKFGQLLSTRPDVVPPDIVAELRTLQDAARPVSFEEVRGVIEADLGLRVEQVFVELDEVPLAAASIGQVHRARLPGGQEVVVKVQRPDAERQIQSDVQLLHQAARVAKERVRKLSFIDLVGLVDEFSRSVRQELDYRVEARNTEAARRNFAGDETVLVPQVYWRYSSARVLTLQRLEGTVLSRVDLASWPLEDRRVLAARMAETWMKMIFDHGFFHADPHPANVMVIEPDRLGLIDFGLIGQLSQRDRQSAVRLLLDIVEQDAERMPRRLRDLGVRFPREREAEFREELGVLLQRYYGVGLEEIDARELLKDVLAMIYRLRIELPTRWVLLDKALATLAGVGLEIYPNYNVFETARPYARRIVAERFRPDRVAGRARGGIERYAEAFLEYPFQLSELLEEFKDGEIKITVLQEGFVEVAEKAQSSSNRLALALVSAALFVGSSLVGAFVKDGPHVLGMAAVALPGLAAALLVGAWLLVGIARSGRW